MFYFFPYDIGNEYNGITNNLLKRCISSDDIYMWLRDVDADNIIMIIDTCHSAASVEGKGFKPGPMESRGLGQLAYDKRMKILTACQTNDVAIESDLIQHGLLTYALINDGINEFQADFNPKDNVILMNEWLEYGLFRLPKLYSEVKKGKISNFGRGPEKTKKIIYLTNKNNRGITIFNAFQKPSLFNFSQNNQDIIIANKTTENRSFPFKKKNHFINLKSKKIVNDIGMTFILIQPGSFIMGSHNGNKDEIPHKVKISNEYYLQTTEVTQGQWEIIMKNNPSKFKNCGKECPVERVSWIDVQKFIDTLNTKDELYSYSLPTEAQWEYAAKSGTENQFYWGEKPDCSKANYGNNKHFKECDNPDQTMKVGSYDPNDFGVYDMQGNVNEWCLDWYNNYPKENQVVVDPIIDKRKHNEPFRKVVRGGGYNDKSIHCRSSNRLRADPSINTADNIGFRLVLIKK